MTALTRDHRDQGDTFRLQRSNSWHANSDFSKSSFSNSLFKRDDHLEGRKVVRIEVPEHVARLVAVLSTIEALAGFLGGDVGAGWS